ncbi:MAG: dipeptidase [Candidatus Hydrogenedentes bacterium]|nr:dipeptidase [Candidatus Hydrogenedentota bacterium]
MRQPVFRRRGLIAVVLMIVFAIVLAYTVLPHLVLAALNRAPDGPFPVSPEAQALHERLFVADMHADSLLWARDLAKRSKRGHIDLPRMAEGHVALQMFTATTEVPARMNIERTPRGWDALVALTFFQRWPAATWRSPFERARYQARRLGELAEASDGRFRVIHNQRELARFVADREEDSGLMGGLLGIEGGHALEGKIENLALLYEAGYRMLGPTHFFDTDLGGSAHGVDKGGITDFGREVVREMEARRMIVDLAHASPTLFDDVIAMATRPLLVSHTGVQGTCDNQRNLSDAQIQAVADTGGLVGIGFWTTAVCDRSVAAIVAAMRYAVDRIGIDHVCLGSDFDGATSAPFDASGMALLTEGMLDAKFSEAEISAIMGGNVLRFLQANLPD